MNAIEQFIGRFIETPLAHAIGWTLLHSLWEGAVIAAALGTALLATRSPRVRYFAACAAMAGMIVAFGITLARPWPTAVPHYPVVRMEISLAAPPAAAPGRVTHSIGWETELEAIAPWLAPFWIVGVILLYMERMAAWISLRRLVRRGVCYASEEWHQRLAELGHRMRVSRTVRLIESSLAEVPMVVGHLRPIILMPVGVLAGLPADQVETILLHELAHIQRCDFLVNILQRLAEGLLFYHPAVWWFSKVMRDERENCCDDVVVAMSEHSHAYASALTALEQNRHVVREAAVAAAGGSLVNRIRRLVAPKAASVGWSGIWAPLVATAIVAALAAASLAARQPQSPEIVSLHAAQVATSGTSGLATSSRPVGRVATSAADGSSAAMGRVQLTPDSISPISLRITSDSRTVFQTIANAAGLNVEFDPSFVPRQISMSVNGVRVEQALDAAAGLSGSHWTATNEKTVLVTADGPTSAVIRTLRMPSATNPQQINALISQIRATFNDSVTVVAAGDDTIVLRGSPSDVALAERLVGNIVGAVNSTAAQTSITASVWPDGAGKTEFLKNCSSCHVPDDVRGHALSSAGWTDEVNHMKQLGMQISDQDFTAVVGYLAAKFGATQASIQPQVVQIQGSATARAGGQLSVSIVDQPPDAYMKWLNEEVVYIISDLERETFLHLTTNAERDQFINQFWERLNPTPGSADNAVKIEHYRRLAYANQTFATKAPGWRTDRGRVYIVYGPPDERYENPAGVNGMYANEVWHYHHIEGIGDDLILEFVDRDERGDFKLAPATVNAR